MPVMTGMHSALPTRLQNLLALAWRQTWASSW